MSPTISIIIPTLNVAPYLEEAMQSAYAQTQSAVEIIIVDNGSTDDTVKVAQRHVSKHPEKVRLMQCATKGASAARNMGWRAAKGDWIQFLDADDLLLPDKLERQSELIQPNISMVVGQSIYQQLDDTRKTIINYDDVWKGTFIGEHAGNTTANLWSRLALEKVGGWDESLANTQDYDLIFRIIKWNDRVAFSTRDDSVHRDRPSGQISQSDPKGNALRAFDLRQKIWHWLQENKTTYFEKEKEFYEQILFAFIQNVARHDIRKSMSLYQQYFPNELKLLRQTPYYHTWYAAFLHNTFGFEFAQKFMKTLRSLRDK